MAPRIRIPHRLIGILLCLVSLLLSGAQAGLQGENMDPQGFLDSLYFYQDTEGSLTQEQVLGAQTIPWQKAESASFNFGFDQSAVWIKFILPKSQRTEDFLLEIANPKFQSISLWLVSPHTPQQIAQTYTVYGTESINKRPIYSRNYVFPIKPSAEADRTLYLRVQTDYQKRIPLFLWTQDQYRKQTNARTLFQGFYFGVVTIMAFYNLCIYFYVKDRSYGTYALFIIFLACFVATERGLAAEYVWPNNPSLDFQMILLFTALGAGISVPFTSYFLSLDVNAPKIAKAYRYFFGVWMFIALLTLLFPKIWLLFVIVAVLIPGGSSLFIVGVLMWRKGVPAAPYFTIAWAIMVFAATLYDAYLMGLFPVSIFTEYSLQVGNMMEVTLLSLGLAHRIKTLGQEKQAANLLSKAKSDFLATMSHEIRTPMNGILGMAELLGDTKLTTQQMNYLNTILNSGQTLLTVLNDILDYSKIEAGKFELEALNYDVRSTLDEATAIFAVKAKEKQLYYNLYVSSKVPQTMLGDPVRIKQVITNLINNAFKFTKQGSVLIRVDRKDNNQLLVEVVDTGIGIPGHKLGSIFEKFTQADSSTSRQFGGTGLGLSISKRFIQAMGGEIGVNSNEGEGSTFWFTLPIQAETAFLAKPNAIASGISLLLITPDTAFIEQLKDYTPHWQFELETTSTLLNACTDFGDSHSAFAIIMLDQHCTDFSDANILRLKQSAWAKQSQLLFLMETGSPRTTLEKLIPTPWFEEFPISVTQLQQRFTTNTDNPQLPTHNAEETLNLSGMRVLVVDDNQVNGLVVTGYLRKLGITPQVVDGGQSALDCVFSAETPYDLILMDCEMPEIDGYLATERIREWERANDKARTPICALSAHAMESYKEKCFTSGMDDFLSKPINFDLLRATMTRHKK